MDCGWIKLHRKIIDSDVFADPLLFKLWCLCLLKANHKKGHFKIDGVNMPVTTDPGQFITGRYELHKDFYKTKRKKNKSAITLWRKLQTLEKMEILNIKSCTKYSIISITNWDKYQQAEQQLNNKRTTTEQQLNTNKNVKNEKNVKKMFTPPTLDEVKTYFADNGYSEISGEKAFNYYDVAGWKDSKGNKVKNWKQKMRGVWFKEENKIKAVLPLSKRAF